MEAIIKKFVRYVLNDRNISKWLVKPIYNLRHGTKSFILPLKDFSTQKKNIIEIFYNKGIFTSHHTKFDVFKNKTKQTATPNIALFKFINPLIHVNCSSIVFNNKILVSRTDGERFNEGFLKIHDSKNGKIFIEEIEFIDSGFFLAGNGSWNWFHFLIEILPKLLLIQKKYTNVLLVNEIVRQIPSMQKLLEILNQDDFKIQYLSPNKTYKVKNLYYVNDFNHVQFNRFDNKIIAEGAYYNFEMTRKFSNEILTRVQIFNNLPTHLFLYRRNTHRISKNQDEIAGYLQTKGFILLCMEELTIEEQISYFKNAKFIIGITGAAWANVIFCRNFPKAICFVPEMAKNSYVYSSLAEGFNVDYYEQTYSSLEEAHTSDFFIDLDQFKQLYETINEKEYPKNY